jgi:plastocyanin
MTFALVFHSAIASSESTASTTTDSISIPLGSSLLTDDAFQPNPVQVSVGDTITWTNDDIVIHAVTSGQDVITDGQFDSGIMNQGDTFEHTSQKQVSSPTFV